MIRRFSVVLAAFAVSTSCMAQGDSLALPEVVVTGTRSAVDVRHLPMTVTVIGRDKLKEQRQPSLLPTVMQQVPGLLLTSRSMMGYGVSTGAAGGISMRGLGGGDGRFLVLIDGHPQYNGVYGHPISDSYQTLMAERVEVVRGPASVLYGSNAMGGVMNIVTRNMKDDGVRTHITLGAGSYGTVQTEASNQLRSGRFSSTVAAQYNRSDNHRPHMAFEQYGGYVKLGYDLSEHWNVSADVNITHWNAGNPGTTQQPKLENEQWITRGEASLMLENHYDKTSGALSLYDNFGRHKINDGYNADGGTPQTDLFRSKDAVAGLSWWQSAQLFTGNRLTVGFDYQHIYGRAWYTDRKTGAVVTTPRRLMQSAHAHENEVAGYVDFRQDLVSWLTLDAGLRYDYHTVAGDEWIPQAGVVWRPMKTGELKATVSKGFRNPTTKEMYMYGSANYETLHAERMINYELAWSGRLIDGALTYGANIFLIDGDNMIQTVDNRNINTGTFHNRGVEVEAAYRIGNHWQVATNHSWLHTNRSIVGAPSYKGFASATYQFEKLSVGVNMQYLYHLCTLAGAAPQHETFCLLGAYANYNLLKNVSLWVRGENLLAQEYELNQGYPMPRATVMGGVEISF